jgi:cysteinyl-tRNA synthetase
MNDLSQNDATDILAYIERLNMVLGILDRSDSAAIDATIEEKIVQRENARKNKDFALADAIRGELKVQGIILLDTSNGVKWKKE